MRDVWFLSHVVLQKVFRPSRPVVVPKGFEKSAQRLVEAGLLTGHKDRFSPTEEGKAATKRLAATLRKSVRPLRDLRGAPDGLYTDADGDHWVLIGKLIAMEEDIGLEPIANIHAASQKSWGPYTKV